MLNFFCYFLMPVLKSWQTLIYKLQVATIFNENVLNFIMIFPLGTKYILGQ